MELVDDSDRASMNAAEEDRISNLPHDIIHRILSFLDMKHAVQTSALSQKWKLLWTTMPHLNLNSHTFRTLRQFAKFVKKALSHRNNHTEVSALELTFTGRGAANDVVVKSIIEYAYSHNVRELTLKHTDFPQYLFDSHTLRHLTLACSGFALIPKSTWDFPALETLNLRSTHLVLGNDRDKSFNLFSKCVNLKDLTLNGIWTDHVVEIFHVCAPQLSNLTIKDGSSLPKVFNVVAPQLQNLTADINGHYSNILQLSTEGFEFDSLEKVNLSFSKVCHEKERYVPAILDLFQKLRSAKFLTLTADIIEALSSCGDQLSLARCPFDKLKCVKIDTKQKDCKVKRPSQVLNYLLHNSPNATLITDLAHVPCKRSIQEVHNEIFMAKKVAKLEAEKKELETNIAQEKKIVEAKTQMQEEVIEKLISRMIKCRMANLKVQIERGNPDFEVIRSIGFEIKSAMELIPESLRLNMETQFSSQYQELKSVLLTRIDVPQWAKIETEVLGNKNTRHPDSIHNHSIVCASELLPASKPSSANVALWKHRRGCLKSGKLA